MAPCRTMFEVAPPIRVVAVVTLFASTFDLMADFLLCARIAEYVSVFESDIAKYAAYGYFFFTVVSIFVYIMEMTDVCLTLKNDEENVFFARLAKSCVLALEEVCGCYALCRMTTRTALQNVRNRKSEFFRFLCHLCSICCLRTNRDCRSPTPY
jgi:hypothetical protein